jgi:putative SOS response-associated peptidase YedK
MLITLPDQSPFAFAGLYETWHGKQNPDETCRSCTIITREAAGAIKNIHHRMPVISRPEIYTPWLDTENQETKSLCEILNTKTITDLIFHPVSKQVNPVRNNNPSNLKPVQTEFEF